MTNNNIYPILEFIVTVWVENVNQPELIYADRGVATTQSRAFSSHALDLQPHDNNFTIHTVHGTVTHTVRYGDTHGTVR